MRSIDTNILARLVLQDDPAQFAAAMRLLERPVWVAPTVWLELGWVLTTRLRMDRRQVGDALGALLSIDTINTPDRAGMMWAVDRFRAGADWADMVHLVCSRNFATSFATFDRAIASVAREGMPLPIETLA